MKTAFVTRILVSTGTIALSAGAAATGQVSISHSSHMESTYVGVSRIRAEMAFSDIVSPRNKFFPKTKFGKKMLELRDNIVKSGEPLIPFDELMENLAKTRRG